MMDDYERAGQMQRVMARWVGEEVQPILPKARGGVAFSIDYLAWVMAIAVATPRPTAPTLHTGRNTVIDALPGKAGLPPQGVVRAAARTMATELAHWEAGIGERRLQRRLARARRRG